MSEVANEVAAAESAGAEVSNGVGAETVDAVETAGSSEPALFEWNGEVDSLRDADWFSGLDEGLRDGVLQGIESKYQNWQRGYTKAFQENAERRKKLDERTKEVRDQEVRVQQWLHGDIDPLVEKQKELDSLQEAHSSVLEALKAEHAEAVDALKTAGNSDLDTARKELQEANTRISDMLAKQDAVARAATEEKATAYEKWIAENAPEILEDDEAFIALVALTTVQVPLERAAAMVKAGFRKEDVAAVVEAAPPEPVPAPVPEPEPVPASMSLMNMGTGQGNGTVSAESRGYEELIRGMRKAAMREGGGIFGDKSG